MMTEREYVINREFGCVVYNIIKSIQNNQCMREHPSLTTQPLNENHNLLNECLEKLMSLQKIVK